MNLFDIFATISLNSEEFNSGIENADKKGESFASKLKSGLGTAAKVGGAAIAAVGTAAVALGTAFTNDVVNLSEYGDAIDKNSQKMGISAKAYQEWDFVLQHSGSSIDAMSKGMITLSKQAESNNEAFAQLGITEEDLATLNKEDLFAKTIEGLQAMGEGTERDALAAQLFGGSAKELGPLLNTTADEVAAMKQQVNDLGGVMSDKAVKDAAALQDSIQNLKTAFDGLKRMFLSDFLPIVTKVSDGLTKILSGNKADGLKDIQKGVTDFVNTLSSKIPDILEIGFGIAEALMQAITENLPMLMEKGADLILNGIIPGILEQLPSLVETAFSIIAQLATSIGQALPELIPAVIDIVLQIVDTLLSPQGIDILIDGALNLVIGLANGIISALPKLLEKAPEIIINLVKAIIRNVPKLFEAAAEIISSLGDGLAAMFGTVGTWGKDLIEKIRSGIETMWTNVSTWGRNIIDKIWDGLKTAITDAVKWGSDLIVNFWNGIKSKLDWLWGKIKSVGQGIKDFLGFSEPKKGPLSNFHTFAPDMMELFMKGIRDNQGKLTETVANAFDFRDAMSGPEMAFAGAAGVSGRGFGTVNLYIDGDTLVGSTSEKMDRDLGDIKTIKARWGGRN